ncbi:MAG: hypothetical protein ABL921_06180 [Pirellula sp.]
MNAKKLHRQLLRSPAFWVVLFSLSMAVIANLGGANGIGSNRSTMADDRPSLAKMSTESTLLCEGAILTEVRGRIRKEGDRFHFVEEATERRYKCLENFCLQRVASAMQGEDRKLVWLVTAKITEFNEENYVLLEKAVRTK